MAATAPSPAPAAEGGAPLRSHRLLLALGLAASAAFILWAGRGTTFIGDEWGWVFAALHPTGATFLDPDNGHLMAFTHAFEIVAVHVAGLGHYFVVRLGALALHLLVAAEVFVLARRRLDARLAVVPALLLALLGTGADAFLTAINTGLLAASAAGLGALIALGRDTRRGDLAAAVLLVLALASWTSAVAFTAGMAVEIALGPTPRRRVWIALVPAVLYVGWRLHWAGGLFAGVGVPGQPTPGVLAALHHAWEALTGAVAGVAGVQLLSPSLHAHLPWLDAAAQVGVAVLVLVLALVWRRRGSARPDARVAGRLANGVVLWLLFGVARGGASDSYASRYVYAGAIIVVLLGVEGLARTRPAPRWRGAVVAAAAVCGALNLVWMVVWGNHLRDESSLARVQLAALDLAGPAAPPSFAPAANEFALADVTAAPYFAARRRFGGDPGARPNTVARASENLREAADRVLAAAAGPRLVAGRARGAAVGPLPAASAAGLSITPTGGCSRLRARGATGYVELAPRGALALALAPTQGALVLVRHWGALFAAGAGAVPGGATATLVVPPQPAWRIRLFVRGSAQVCSTGAIR